MNESQRRCWKSWRTASVFIVAAVISFTQVGCVSDGVKPTVIKDDEDGRGASWWGPGNIRQAAQKIADRMVQVPKIMNSDRVVYIICDNPINQSSFPELSRNDIWTEKLITELSRRKEFMDKVAFVNRERWKKIDDERKFKETGTVTGSGNVAYAGATYTLGYKFMDASTSSGGYRQVAIDVLATLIDNQTQVEAFREEFSLRKYGSRSEAYQ